MNGRREDPNSSSCYFHPEDDFVGVCPLCLHERLLILAARQKQLRRRRKDPGGRGRSQPSADSSNPKPPINLPKMFALGSFLNRLEFRHYWRSEGGDLDREASTSPEDDSFISIKIGNNGAASWEKKNTAAAAATMTKSKVSLDNCNISWNHQSLNKMDPTKTTTTNSKCVIEHVKPRAGSLRWRKRIGHLFHLIRWKGSSKASACHVSTKVEGVKVRNNGWIRTLTKRRAKE